MKCLIMNLKQHLIKDVLNFVQIVQINFDDKVGKLRILPESKLNESAS